jgi:hypothetical protein
MQHTVAVIQPEQQRSYRAFFLALVPAQARDDAVCGAQVFDLHHRPHTRTVRSLRALRDDAVEPRAFELIEPA